MTHTPGPWKVLCGDVVLECNEKEVVAWVGNIDGQMINNAHLIAAAPEMLDLLMEAVARVEMGHDLTSTGWSDKAMDLVRRVIE